MNGRRLALFLAFVLLGACALQAPVLAQGDELAAYMERGRALAKAGKHEQALPYFMLSLERAEARLGPEDPGLVPFLDGLAAVHAARESYGDAEPLYERALAIQEREAERYQSGIARTLNSLGGIYEATDRRPAAMVVYRRVLTAWASVLGSDHPEVQVAGGRLAKLALRPPSAPGEPGEPSEPSEPSTPGPGLVEAPPQDPMPEPPREPPRAKPAPPAAVARPPPVAEAAQAPAQAQAPTLAPAPVPKPRLAPAREGLGYAIHLTSIRKPEGAQAEWDRLRRLYGALLEGLALRVARVDLGPPRGVYYRIQGGPLTRAAARERCAPFRKRGAWCGVLRVGVAPETPRPETPRPITRAAPAPQVPPAPPGTEARPAEGYLIHLTSIRKPEHAEAEWRRLKRLHGSVLAGLELSVQRVDLGPGRGVYYRIQGGPLSRQAARKLCAHFAALKIWCRVARPGETAAEAPSRLALQRVKRRGAAGPRGTRRYRRRSAWPASRRVRRDPGCRRSPFAVPAGSLVSRPCTRARHRPPPFR